MGRQIGMFRCILNFMIRLTQQRLVGYAGIGLLFLMAVSGCAPAVIQTSNPLPSQIAGLQTEQAVLSTQLAVLEVTATATAEPTQQPTASLAPTANEANKIVLPQPIYFLGLDASERPQVFRLDRDGINWMQITAEERTILDYDISQSGHLAIIVKEETPQQILRLVLHSGLLDSGVVIDERQGDLETIQYVRWLPDGEHLVYHRTLQIASDEEAPNQAPSAAPAFAHELVLYNRLTKASEILLRDGPEPVLPLEDALTTSESSEYDAANDWPTAYQTTGFSPDSRFLLITDSGGPFWWVYDRLAMGARQARIIAASADISPDGQALCLASDFSKPDFQPPQALLCGDFNSDSIVVFLSHPPWKPLAVNLWFSENALLFLQDVLSENGAEIVQLFGLNLAESEPLLLREEPWQSGLPADILHTPAENLVDAMVVLAGQATAMDAPGLVVLPVDPQKPAIYLPELGVVRQLRWGPLTLP
jgi:hypothetical protein